LSAFCRKKLIIKETHAYVSVIFNFSRRKISIAIFCRFTTPTPTPPPKIAVILFYFLPSQHQTFGGNVVEGTLQTNAADIFLLEQLRPQ
jgi:hypothetical protein